MSFGAAGRMLAGALILLFSGAVHADGPGSIPMLVACPGAMPSDPNPYFELMERHAGTGTFGSPERCPFHNAERLFRNFGHCKGLVFVAASVASEYAKAQREHVQQHGRESPLFTRHKALETLVLARERGTYTGNRYADAVDMAYAGRSTTEIKEALFCRCLLDSHEREFGGTHEVDLVPRAYCR